LNKKLLACFVLLTLVTIPVVKANDENFEEEIVELQNLEDQSVPVEIDQVDAARRLDDIQRSINSTQSTLNRSMTDTSLLEQRLGDVTDEIKTLEGQLSNISQQIDKTERRVVFISLNIQRNEEQIDALMQEIGILFRQIEIQKKKFSDLLLLIYFQSEQVGFFDPADLQTIKLLLADEMVSDMLARVENLSILEYSLGDLINLMQASREKLELDKKLVEDTTRQLNELKSKLDEELVFLSLQRNAKQSLLDATQGEERLYRELLERAREEQMQIRAEFINLLRVHNQYKQILEQVGFADDDFELKGVLSWPVSPSLGISAYFRDPSYRAALGLDHDAIDIRAPQGTTVVAPADGIVLKTKGGTGNDYHFIVIGHGSEVMTLYGHMYDIFVRPGQSVRRGEAIGLSGGMPGTRGAGWLTTGPHLHFEVFRNGVHVDPMEYLDLTALPQRYIR
jgi:murein DD-endopeptidase MepM/ murein hydrolase activator NlpD